MNTIFNYAPFDVSDDIVPCRMSFLHRLRRQPSFRRSQTTAAIAIRHIKCSLNDDGRRMDIGTEDGVQVVCTVCFGCILGRSRLTCSSVSRDLGYSTPPELAYLISAWHADAESGVFVGVLYPRS